MSKDLKELEKLFYNPIIGLVNTLKLYKKAKENNLDLTQKEINEFYNKQPINQILKPFRKAKQFSSIIAYYPRQLYQMDIMVYDRYAYHNYKYILVVIDVNSRYLDARAMTNREMKTIINNFESIMQDMGYPEKIQADNEFNKKDFNELLKEHNISALYSQPHEINKNAIVERVNATISNYLQKVRLTTNKYDWYNYLSDIIENYNNTIHSTTKEKPKDIFEGNATSQQKIKVVDNPFKIGDKVRVAIKKKVFDKIDTLKYSPEIYIIKSINKNKIKLEGQNIFYKPYELKHINDIIETNTISEPKTETKNNKIINLHKILDINKNNIIDTKRAKKPNNKYI